MATGSSEKLSILLVDDESDILRTVGNYLEGRGYGVFPASSGAEGMDILRTQAVDIIITDIRMPGMDGLELLHQAKTISPEVEVIMVTAYGEVEMAVRAMRQGAFDFFTKPVKMRELMASLERTVRFHTLRREKDRVQARLDRLDRDARRRYGLAGIFGESQAIQLVKNLVQQVSRTDATTVMVCGETGTGKELVARAIHHESARSGGPFVAVDCTSIPESLVESEFYGHVKGAFTDAREGHAGHFETAHEGTLFLDEIGDMPPGMQVRLLRTLEERRVRRVGGSNETPVDVRVVSATNQDLEQAVSNGRFREDLYYRLNTFTIYVPPLRERPDDILLLAEYMLRQICRELRKPIDRFSPEAADTLKVHPFPGNVRELRNTVERAAILCQGRQVTAEDLRLPRPLHGPITPAAERRDDAPPAPIEEAPTPPPGRVSLAGLPDLNLGSIEREVIQEALRRCDSNRVQAARMLGLSRMALHRRIVHHGL